MIQKTLRQSIACTGVALHSGAETTLTLKPAAADTGIRFRRLDVAGRDNVIPARWDHVVDTRLCTVLGNQAGVTLSTVEHLMAALAGCGIDNAEIEVSGPEIPAMDGSAAPFVLLIECAGIVEQAAPRRAIRIEKPVSVEDGFGRVALYPAPEFIMDFAIDFDSAAIGRQSASLKLSEGVFKDQVSRARTFGFLSDVERLKAAGLARGGSTANAVVISGDRVINDGGLRFEDEFVRHKMLDALGDLYLCGYPIIGRFEGERSGHDLNNRLLRALLADESLWSWSETSPHGSRGSYRVNQDGPIAATA